MQNLSNNPNDIFLDQNFGRTNNENSRYSDSDSWDTDFEDEGIESAELYGDVEAQKEELEKSRNHYNVASLSKTVAASLQISSNEKYSGSERPRPKNEMGDVPQKPMVPVRPPTVTSTATAKNKTVSSLPKPPCQASEHVRQVIGNLSHLWPSQKSGTTKQDDDYYEPISGGGTPNSSTLKVPPKTQASFLHSSSSSTSSAPGAIPTRRAPPRPSGPPTVPFIHGPSAATALGRLAGAAAAEASKQSQQQLSARTSRTLPVETKEKCIDDKRAATLPTALSSPPSTSTHPPPTSTHPPPVSNRPLPPTPAVTSSGSSSSSSSSGANLASTLVSRPWFHDLDRRRAEELVRNGVDGYFLVRPSSQSTHALTLTMWYNNRVYNISIRSRPDGRIALGTVKPNEQSFVTVDEMVTNYQSENLVLFSGGKRTGLTVLTTYPPHKN